MKRKIVIIEKPMSVNAASSADIRYKSTAYNEWYPAVCSQLKLKNNQKSLKELREFADPSKHYFIFNMTVYYPEDIFWTKEGQISSRTVDKSNDDKPIVDLIFLPEFNKAKNKRGSNNLKIDDKYICDLHSFKRPTRGKKTMLVIEIEIRDKNELELEPDL